MLPLLVGGMVSGSISLPSRGSFRLSLTVLVHYRWQEVFSLRRWFSRIPTEFLVIRGTWVLSKSLHPFAYGAITRCGRASQTRSAREKVGNSSGLLPLTQDSPATPIAQRRQAIFTQWV